MKTHVPIDNNQTFPGMDPSVNNGIPFNGENHPTFNSNQPPTFNGNFPPSLNGNVPSLNPSFGGGETEFTDDGLSFNHIGPPINEFGPSSRVKREVVFPDEVDNEILESDGDVVADAADGRALKQTIQSVTKIDVGVQSQLLVAPGSTSIIYFDVTNLRNEPSFHSFSVQDEKRYLRAMEPRALWLQPNQKESVRVTIMVPQGADLGTKDKITLTSQGVAQVSQSVVVTVTTNGVNDPWAPHVWYTYNTRCDWRQSCVGGTWSIEVVARDYESGLMSLRSNPEGLLLRAPFTAGTNDEVKATYSASCCEPRVSISAYDLNRNQRTIQLNVDDPWLSDYAIATVVLAVLFFILLIILIIIWIVWCCKRRSASRDLPTYRAGDIRPRP